MGAFLFILVLFLAIVFYGIFALDLEIGTIASPGTGFFPAALAGVGFIIGIGCVTTALLQLLRSSQSTHHGGGAEGLTWSNSCRLLVVFSICLLYPFFLQWIGYLASNGIIALLMLLFGGVKVRSALLMAVIIGACLYLLIVQVLSVHMPEGDLWFF